MMNEELLAASALLVQSGAWLVSVNIKLAWGFQTVKNLVFGLLYAGWYLQLPYVKPTQVCSAPTASQAILANYFQQSAIVWWSCGFLCILLVSRVWEISSASSPSFSLAERICRRCANSLSKTPAVSQSTFIIGQYTRPVISRDRLN